MRYGRMRLPEMSRSTVPEVRMPLGRYPGRVTSVSPGSLKKHFSGVLRALGAVGRTQCASPVAQ